MNADGFIEVLRHGLLSFIKDVYPASHRLMMDNEPKHTSNKAKDFLEWHGGKLQQNHQIVTQSRIYGMNLKSLYAVK